MRCDQRTYGPISDGVTGSEGGGGRLIKVGVVIFFSFPVFGSSTTQLEWEDTLNHSNVKEREQKTDNNPNNR